MLQLTMKEYLPIFNDARDESEAKGEIWLRRETYGYALYIRGCHLDENGKEQAVCLIDLFPAANQDIKTYDGVLGQIQIYTPDPDAGPCSTIQFGKNFTVLDMGKELERLT